jgi:hypothetical protein
MPFACRKKLPILVPASAAELIQRRLMYLKPTAGRASEAYPGVLYSPLSKGALDDRAAPQRGILRIHGTPIIRRIAMFRFALIVLAGFILVAASLVPDDAFARRGGGFHGGGMRAGGFHGGGMRAGAVHGGRYAAAGRYRVAGGVRPSHPIAGRPGYRPGYPVAGRPGYGWRGAAWGAAAGAAALGAYGAYGAYYGNNYNNGCYQNTYGQWVCPNQYGYQYQY